MAENSTAEINNPSGLPLNVQLAIGAFVAVAWHNSVWINFAAFIVFNKRKGLYFWLLIIASWGCVLHQVGALILFFKLTDRLVPTLLLLDIGFYGMSHSRPDIRAMYPIWEKIEVTGMGMQEVIISSIYIYETRKLLKPSEQFQKEKFRQSMRHLIYASIIVIMMDLATVSLQYANFFDLQVTLKGAVYSVKLLIEFFVLNELRSVVGGTVVAYGKSSSSRAGVSIDQKESKTQKKPRVLSRADYINVEEIVKLEDFPKPDSTASSNQKLGTSQPPVISVDKNNKNMPSQPDKILVSRTVECVPSDDVRRSTIGVPSSKPSSRPRPRPASRSFSQASSEEYFPAHWM